MKPVQVKVMRIEDEISLEKLLKMIGVVIEEEEMIIIETDEMITVESGDIARRPVQRQEARDHRRESGIKPDMQMIGTGSMRAMAQDEKKKDIITKTNRKSMNRNIISRANG